MPTDICDCCGSLIHWNWEEAFSKFGFNDGDGLIFTEEVADTLRDAGYAVETMVWGIHNAVVTKIAKQGVPLIPEAATIGFAHMLYDWCKLFGQPLLFFVGELTRFFAGGGSIFVHVRFLRSPHSPPSLSRDHSRLVYELDVSRFDAVCVPHDPQRVTEVVAEFRPSRFCLASILDIVGVSVGLIHTHVSAV